MTAHKGKDLTNPLFSRAAGALALALGLALWLTGSPVLAQTYTDVKRLGTSQAVCKPGIQTREELQQFFANDAESVISILRDAGWKGNPQDLFDAIAAGNFTEGAIQPGDRLDWMSARKGGKAVSLPYRRWAGSEPVDVFALTLESNCEAHDIVIPKICCNLSLVSSQPVTPPAPALRTNVDGDTLSVCSDPDATVMLTHPDGREETLALDENGCWSGTAPVGSYTAKAMRSGDCGTADASSVATVAGPAAPIAAPLPALIPFIGLFLGTEVRPRFELEWQKDMVDPSGILGIKAGVLKPIDEQLSAFVQAGYIRRTGVGNGFDYPDDNVFADIGLETRVGQKGFFGGGVGVVNLNDSDTRDGSLFAHFGSDIGQTAAQWFVEGRVFTEELGDIGDNHQVSVGLRYLFK